MASGNKDVQALELIAEQLGAKLTDVPNDGHCFYNAVRLCYSNVCQKQVSVQDMRGRVADELLKRQSEFQPFVVSDRTGERIRGQERDMSVASDLQLEIYRNVSDTDRATADEISFMIEVEKIRKNRWAEEIDVRILAELLQVSIHVHKVQGQSVFLACHDYGDKTLHLGLIGQQHYMAMLRNR